MTAAARALLRHVWENLAHVSDRCHCCSWRVYPSVFVGALRENGGDIVHSVVILGGRIDELLCLYFLYKAHARRRNGQLNVECPAKPFTGAHAQT